MFSWKQGAWLASASVVSSSLTLRCLRLKTGFVIHLVSHTLPARGRVSNPTIALSPQHADPACGDGRAVMEGAALGPSSKIFLRKANVR